MAFFVWAYAGSYGFTCSYSLVVIPPDLWNGFKGMGREPAIVADVIDIPHEEADSTRIDPHNNHIPYDWSVKER